MDEQAFETLADRTLRALLARIEGVLADAVEADLDGGILTVELEDGRKFVINKHGPNRQIWLSSPISGAAHFRWDEARGEWLSTRGGEALAPRLAAELSAATGTDIAFDRA